VLCGNKIEPVDQFFSPSNGGVVCPDCNNDGCFSKNIQMHTLKYLRHLQRSTFEKALAPNFNAYVIQDAYVYLIDFMKHYLDRTPKSLAYLSM
jgi:DNA repair protein RecO (recombination protein O)